MHAVVLALLLPLATQAFLFGCGGGCGGGCGCQPAQPVCPPPPVCAPQYQPPAYIPPAPQGYAVGPSFDQGVVGGAQSFGGAGPVSYDNQAVGGAVVGSEQVAVTAGPVVDSTAAPGGVTAENTVYDDIVNAAAQGSSVSADAYSQAVQQALRRRKHKIRRAPAANFDPKCNSETLKTIIQENIGDSTSASKRSIQKKASEEIGGHIDVICSTGTFSYIVNTELYCETEKDGITCFAFRQSH